MKSGKWTWSHRVDIGVKLKVLVGSIGMQKIMRIGEGVPELLAIGGGGQSRVKQRARTWT